VIIVVLCAFPVVIVPWLDVPLIGLPLIVVDQPWKMYVLLPTFIVEENVNSKFVCGLVPMFAHLPGAIKVDVPCMGLPPLFVPVYVALKEDPDGSPVVAKPTFPAPLSAATKAIANEDINTVNSVIRSND